MISRTGRLTTEQQQQIIDLYNNGTEINDIAQTMEIDFTTIYKMFKRLGIKPSRMPRSPNENDEENICTDYKSGISTHAISKKYGWYDSTIRRVLKRHNIKIKSGLKGYHHTKEAKDKIGEAARGANNPNWKNGRTRDIQGYVMVLVSGNGISRKYVGEHRLIMEDHLGRKLSPEEHVHHINGIRDDNRIENLMIVNRNRHYGEVSCPACGHKFLVK